MPLEKYTVIVSERRFVFTRDQLESEPGNFLATYFLGGFREARTGTKELELETEPLLFELIQAHLRGYDIFPIEDACVPPEIYVKGEHAEGAEERSRLLWAGEVVAVDR